MAIFGILHIYEIKNACLWNHRRRERTASHMVCVLCCFLIIFYSLSSLSEHWALPEHWSCTVGTCAGESAPWAMDARKALSKVEWRGNEGRWFDHGNQLVFIFAGSFWLLQGLSNWEDGSRGLTNVWPGKKLLMQAWEGDRLERHSYMQ